MLEKIINWLENNLQPCFYKKFIGIDCPGCGMQRSIIELLKGNLYESFVFYPALFPIVFMLIFLFLHLIFKYKNGANILKWTFIINVIIIFGNFIYKTWIGTC